MFSTLRLAAVFIYTLVANNMEKRYDDLARTILYRLTKDHNNLSSENLFKKYNTHLTKLLDEVWEMIKELITKESKKTRAFTERILDERLKQEHGEIIQIKGIVVLPKASVF